MVARVCELGTDGTVSRPALEGGARPAASDTSDTVRTADTRACEAPHHAAATRRLPSTMPTLPCPLETDAVPPVRIDFPGGTTVFHQLSATHGDGRGPEQKTTATHSQSSPTEVRSAVASDRVAPDLAAGWDDRAELLRVDGPHAGHLWSVDTLSLRIGRSATCDLTVDDGGVSRVHARVYRSRGVNWVEDLGSRNGTFVRGRRVEICRLHSGDWIQLGPRVCFRFYTVVHTAQPVDHRSGPAEASDRARRACRE